MRGFVIGAASLAVLDLVLRSPAARVATALTLPTRWLREWMDPAVPLVPDRAGVTKAAVSTQPSPTSAVLA